MSQQTSSDLLSHVAVTHYTYRMIGTQCLSSGWVQLHQNCMLGLLYFQLNPKIVSSGAGLDWDKNLALGLWSRLAHHNPRADTVPTWSVDVLYI